MSAAVEQARSFAARIPGMTPDDAALLTFTTLREASPELRDEMCEALARALAAAGMADDVAQAAFTEALSYGGLDGSTPGSANAIPTRYRPARWLNLTAIEMTGREIGIGFVDDAGAVLLRVPVTDLVRLSVRLTAVQSQLKLAAAARDGGHGTGQDGAIR